MWTFLLALAGFFLAWTGGVELPRAAIGVKSPIESRPLLRPESGTAPMRVVACQFSPVWEEKPASLAAAARLIEAAGPMRGALILLPEMFATGFSLNLPAVREGTERQAERFLRELAGKTGCATLGGVVNESPAGKGLNQAVAFDPAGRELVRYTKLHPFSFGGEAKHFVGGEGVATFDWGGMRVAPLICYDLRFPEAFRLATRRGAQVLAVLANFPSARESHWVTLLTARAIENQAYVVGVNRCGADPYLPYPGRSLIIGPRGDILADAGPGEAVISAELDLDDLLDYRAKFPALRDMRDDLMGG